LRVILKIYPNRKGWIQKLGFVLFRFLYPNFQDFNLILDSTIRYGPCIQMISQPNMAISATKIYPFSVSNRHSLTIRFDIWSFDKLGCMYRKVSAIFDKKVIVGSLARNLTFLQAKFLCNKNWIKRHRLALGYIEIS
jgi:hypothetical protein